MSDHRQQGYPRCYEIWMCDLGSNGVGIQSGYRPVLILSNDRNNLFSPTVNVAPMTTKMNKRNLPVHVELWNNKAYGLLSPSTVLIEQLTTVHVNALDRKIGQIADDETLAQIYTAVSVQFPIIQALSTLPLTS